MQEMSIINTNVLIKYLKGLFLITLNYFNMKRILFFLITVILVSCKNDQNINYALISGKIDNSTAEKLIINNSDFEKEITITPDGTFADTLKLLESGFYTLKIGRETTSIYLKNGDNIHVTLDTNQFDETITYTGIGSNENNYIAAKQLYEEKFTSDFKGLYSLEEDAFKVKIDSFKQTKTSLLGKIENVDPDFLTNETRNLEYDSYILFDNYKNYHGRYAEIENYEVPDVFLPEGLKNITYDDPNAYKMSSSYKRMAYNSTLNDLFKSIGDDYLYTSPEELKDINSIKIPQLKDDLVSYLGGFIVSPGNPYMQEVYDFFLANTNNEKIKTKLKEVFEKGKDLMKGTPSPQFSNYENHKGGTMSLTDLKGKYVYIDVWATWCGPCLREIPSLKEVEQQFHDKNIAFVSTSVDVAKDHDKWVSMVNDKNLGGIQLFADNDMSSEFIKNYGIKGIPRFILIDPEGNIVSADAPRPSNPRLVELLNSLDNI
jgi:thiol-disulfide isomerase/thioredoxin